MATITLWRWTNYPLYGWPSYAILATQERYTAISGKDGTMVVRLIKYRIYSIRCPGTLTFSKREAFIRVKFSHLIKGLWWVALVMLFNQNCLNIVISGDRSSCLWATQCFVLFSRWSACLTLTPNTEFLRILFPRGQNPPKPWSAAPGIWTPDLLKTCRATPH